MENISGNAIIIKEININFVRKVLKDKGQATKQEIAKETGLSFVTVGTALQHLLTQNEIFEAKMAQSSGGRPAQQYSYNYDFAHALALHTYEKEGLHFIHSSVINLNGEIVSELDFQTEVIDVHIFEDIIEKKIKKYPLIKAISFGHHGVELNGEIISSDYEMLEGIPFADHFSNLYQIPVVLENDVHAAVLGFSKRREIKEDETLVYIHFSENGIPSAGILINGNLFKGKTNYAGEISKMPLDIEWNNALSNDSEKIIPAISKLIMSISSLINPHTFIINANFLDRIKLSRINKICKDSLPNNLVPKMYISENFMKDYKSGLIMRALQQLEPNIALTKKKNYFE